MKRTNYNLSVIQNFIEYYTTDEAERDAMKLEAQTYIDEDHADGEQMPEVDNNIFFVADMRNSFIAGEEFESDTYMVDEGHRDELIQPDFGEWIEKNYEIKL